jgi:mannose-6-phosphate isomerase-like protein (cupin superfamily)
MTSFDDATLPDVADCTARDGSEIRLLGKTKNGSLCHARLAADQVASAVRHRNVDELWFCLRGAGRIWRKSAEREGIVDLREGSSITLPAGTSFQWRNDGPGTLDVLIATIPPWPGDEEAVDVGGAWAPRKGC